MFFVRDEGEKEKETTDRGRLVSASTPTKKSSSTSDLHPFM